MSVSTDERPAEAAAAAKSQDAHWQAKMEKMRARKLPQRSIEFFDDELRAERDMAEAELLAAKADKDEDKTAAAQAKFDQAEAAYNDTVVEWTFRAIPRPQYEALISDHPPTDKQERDGMAYNEHTFAPALIAACSVDGLTVEAAIELIGQEEVDEDGKTKILVEGTLNAGEALAMFRTCTQMCERIRVDVGKGSRPTPG